MLTMITKDVEEYKPYKKNRNKTTKKERRRENFLTTMKQIYCAVQPDYEMLLYEFRDEKNWDERYKKYWLHAGCARRKSNNFFRE